MGFGSADIGLHTGILFNPHGENTKWVFVLNIMAKGLERSLTALVVSFASTVATLPDITGKIQEKNG